MRAPSESWSNAQRIKSVRIASTMVHPSFLSLLALLPPDLRSPLGVLEYVRPRTFFFRLALHVRPVVSFCVFVALVFTVEWALTSAKSSRSILTHGHLNKWRYVFSPFLTLYSLINLQDRTYKNGAIGLPTYTGKHISNRAMFPQISEYRPLVVIGPLSDITITISVR